MEDKIRVIDLLAAEKGLITCTAVKVDGEWVLVYCDGFPAGFVEEILE